MRKGRAVKRHFDAFRNVELLEGKHYWNESVVHVFLRKIKFRALRQDGIKEQSSTKC